MRYLEEWMDNIVQNNSFVKQASFSLCTVGNKNFTLSVIYSADEWLQVELCVNANGL
jgi:hypothetical protein